MSGKEEGVWFTRRSDLCAKGFTFEYSATFEQAVQASGNADLRTATPRRSFLITPTGGSMRTVSARIIRS